MTDTSPEGPKPDFKAALGVMTPAEVAEVLDVTVGTLREWRSQGKGPDFVRTGKKVKYLVADVRSWIELNRVTTVRS